jgi:serine/threonine protein kinase
MGTGARAAHARDRLLREAQALAQLSDPAVVHLYDVQVWGDSVYLTMELVDGLPMSRWLHAERRSVQDIVSLFVRIGEGLAAAHALGMVHRDFKPDNLMVDRQGRPRILDFGLARAMNELPAQGSASIEDPSHAALQPIAAAAASHRSLIGEALTAPGAIVGTPPYMAPEQIAGYPVVPAADQFSFCVTLVEALTGQRPFHGNSRQELFHAITHAPPSIAGAGWLPPALEQVLRIGLAKNTAQRYPSLRHLLGALEASISAVPLAPGPEPGRRAHPLAWIAVGAIVAAAGAGAVALALGPSSSDESQASEGRRDGSRSRGEPSDSEDEETSAAAASSASAVSQAAGPPRPRRAGLSAGSSAPPTSTPPAQSEPQLCKTLADCPGPNAQCVIGKCVSCPLGQAYFNGGCRSPCRNRSDCPPNHDCFHINPARSTTYCVPLR